jgi:glycine/D-amino acid oxidase-like deaminating enzyme/nitrite reductase/ring-hydroxylating ferredoxin subunit
MNENTSLWKEVSLPRHSGVETAQKFDVIVIGGGTTGLTAAYLLQRSGKRVAVLERYRLGAGDTGNTTAHLTAVTDLRLSRLEKNFGTDAARLVWRGGMAAIATIEAIAGSGCDFQRLPGFLHLAIDGEDDDKKRLADEAEIAREWGAEATFIAAVPYFDLPGIRFADQAKFHPFKYLQKLAGSFTGNGGKVYENCDVTEIRDEPLTVVINDNVELRCDYVVIATHVPLMGKTGLISATLTQSKLAPYTSYVIGAKMPKRTMPRALFWDTADPYYYLRVEAHDDNDYLIFGGCDNKTGQVDDTQAQFDKLREKLQQLVPEAEFDRQWSGQVVETNDGLPYIGETADRQFVATGFSGNGMTFGTLAAMMACDRVLGRENPWADLFSVDRKKIRGGTLDYLRENIDYPYYMLRDRFATSEVESVDDVQPGEGKLLNVDGRRVACFRDEDGSLSTVSAVCTHMGCSVRWNNAEQTWDCPCHGSRFLPTGEVLAGPAETPLESVDVRANHAAAH